MRLLFKQRFFSWLDSYDIYDVSGNILFSVEKGKPFYYIIQADSIRILIVCRNLYASAENLMNFVLAHPNSIVLHAYTNIIVIPVYG